MTRLLPQRQAFVDDYLKRLQYSGPVSPNLETLKSLHRHHMLTIPFENLCNVLQEEYPSTKEDLFKKIILDHRGGLCFELNTLFALLLQDIGFNLVMVGAKVYMQHGFAQFDNHQASIVSLGEEKWIVDVGFGECFTVPLRLLGGEIQDDETGVYRIRKDPDEAGQEDQEWFIIESNSKNIVVLHFQDEADKREDAEWNYKYKFNLIPRTINILTKPER